MNCVGPAPSMISPSWGPSALFRPVLRDGSSTNTAAPRWPMGITITWSIDAVWARTERARSYAGPAVFLLKLSRLWISMLQQPGPKRERSNLLLLATAFCPTDSFPTLFFLRAAGTWKGIIGIAQTGTTMGLVACVKILFTNIQDFYCCYSVT